MVPTISTISIVTSITTQSDYNIIVYIHYAVHHILMTYQMYNWKFASLNPLHLSPLHPPNPPPSGNHQFIYSCIYGH